MVVCSSDRRLFRLTPSASRLWDELHRAPLTTSAAAQRLADVYGRPLTELEKATSDFLLALGERGWIVASSDGADGQGGPVPRPAPEWELPPLPWTPLAVTPVASARELLEVVRIDLRRATCRVLAGGGLVIDRGSGTLFRLSPEGTWLWTLIARLQPTFEELIDRVCAAVDEPRSDLSCATAVFLAALERRGMLRKLRFDPPDLASGSHPGLEIIFRADSRCPFRPEIQAAAKLEGLCPARR